MIGNRFFLRNNPKRRVTWVEGNQPEKCTEKSLPAIMPFIFISRAESLNCLHWQRAGTLSKFMIPASCIPYPATMTKLWTSGYYRFTLQPPQEKHRRFSRFFHELNFIFARLEWLHSWQVAKIISFEKNVTLIIYVKNKKQKKGIVSIFTIQ